MVVNGTTWPKFEVAPARYRLRLLNGCNSRTLNLSHVRRDSLAPTAFPGRLMTSSARKSPSTRSARNRDSCPRSSRSRPALPPCFPVTAPFRRPLPAPDPDQALLMGPAERADVIVDFSGMANGTRIRMINTAPDSPFGASLISAADSAHHRPGDGFHREHCLDCQPSDTTSTPAGKPGSPRGGSARRCNEYAPGVSQRIVF